MGDAAEVAGQGDRASGVHEGFGLPHAGTQGDTDQGHLG